MTNLYLFSSVSGGIILLASIFLGHKGECDHGGHHGDAHLELGDQDAVDGPVDGVLAALLSLRFWTFGLTFFGITGLTLDGLGVPESRIHVALVALLMGLVIGLAAVATFRRLAATETNNAADERDYVGKTGRVLVAFGAGGLGKVRLVVRGATVDVLAKTDESEPFAAGDEALVIHMSDMTAVVIRPGESAA